VPSSLAAIGKVPAEGWPQWVALGGLYEIVANKPNASGPSNYGRGWPGITGKSMKKPAKRSRSLSLGLARGRLAMVAIMGMMFPDGNFGTTCPQVWAPGNAFENELGVQAPVRFWDPVGVCKDGDVDDFKRRLKTELKHGRVAMRAAMGFVTPEYFKFPGYLSPSAGLKFEDVPSGLAAIGKVPEEGALESELGVQAPVGLRDPVGKDGDIGDFKRRRGAELRHGRVATCAAMVFVTSEPGNRGRGWLGITGKSRGDPAKRSRSLNSGLAAHRR
jgi:hypothetical protein